MSKIQTGKSVFKVVILGIMILIGSPLAAVDMTTQLNQADSLFRSGKYTESFDIYNTVYEQSHYTPSMLLKMAYIKEGLGDISGALYFLNVYYNVTSNKKVLTKVGEIAQENQLTGYEFTDFDFFLNLYHRYQLQALGLVLVIVFLLFARIILLKRKTHQRPISSGIAFLIAVAGFLYLLNYDLGQNKGIIIDQQTYLMAGPSGGADVVGIIERGHRVNIVGIQGIWVKIIWDNQEVYIRSSKIKALG